MATKDAIAARCVMKLQEAARREWRPRPDPNSVVVRALKEVNADVASLPETERAIVVETIADRLGVQRPRFKVLVREASNDHFIQLVSFWDDFLQDLKV